MNPERQHELVRDATLTFAHMIKTYLPAKLENKPVEVVFKIPSQADIETAKKNGAALVSVIHVDTQKSTQVQSTFEPIVRKEDDSGGITEYRQAPPVFITPRYMITPWCDDPLLDQVMTGLLLQLFYDHTYFAPEDVRGNSIHTEDQPPISHDEKFKIDEQMRFWQASGGTFRPSLVFTVTLRLDSPRLQPIRRVKERVLDYKKLEG